MFNIFLNYLQLQIIKNCWLVKYIMHPLILITNIVNISVNNMNMTHFNMFIPLRDH